MVKQYSRNIRVLEASSSLLLKLMTSNGAMKEAFIAYGITGIIRNTLETILVVTKCDLQGNTDFFDKFSLLCKHTGCTMKLAEVCSIW